MRQMTTDVARPGRTRAVLRFVAAVKATSGVLLIADAVATLAWQEPVSAILANREQAKLEEQLSDPPGGCCGGSRCQATRSEGSNCPR